MQVTVFSKKIGIKRALHILVSAICSVSLAFSPVGVSAFDNKYDEGFYSKNDILFYRPDACSATASDTTLSDTVVGSGSVGAYKNPVYDKGSAADPSAVFGDDGKFHVFATANVHLVSDNMSKWKKVDKGWNVKGAPSDAGGAKWAPDVIKIGQKWILTYTIPTGTSEYPGRGGPKIGYAVADSINGPFNFKDKFVLSYPYSIDSHLFQDDNGKIWMFWGGGAINVVEMTFDGSTLKVKGSPKQVLTKGGVGSSATIEGAWVSKHDGWYYLTYSQGHYKRTDGPPEYRVLVARSKTVDGPYSPNNSMKPILEGKGDIHFPGHHSMITDSSGSDWIVYHGYFKNNQSSRMLMIDKVTYKNGWPVVNDGNGPSSSKQQGSTASANTDDDSGTGGSNISIFGDSLTVGMKSQGDLQKKLSDAGWNVQTVTAKGGGNIAWARDQLKKDNVKKAVSKSDTVVIAMGTNADDNPKKQVEGIVKEIRDISPDIAIYWVNIFTPKKNAYRDNMNKILKTKSNSLSFTVIDWYSEVKDKTNYYEFIPNNIHHTALGYQRKSEFIVNSLAQLSGNQEDSPSLDTVVSDSTSGSNATCCSEVGGTIISDVSLVGRDNAEKVFNFLTGADESNLKLSTNGNRPLNPVQAAAFIGNFAQESGIDPKSVNSIGATGIAQWLGGRKQGLIALSNPMTLGTQLQFLKTELEGSEKAIIAHADFKNAKDVTDVARATVAVRKIYERPGAAEANDTNRIAQATQALNDFGSGTPTASGVTTPVLSSSSCGGTTTNADLGPGQGDFTDSGEINGWNIVQANSILTDKEFGDSMVNSGRCAAIVARVFGASGYGNWNNGRFGTTNAYAASMWYQYYKTSVAHADRNPKKGSWLYYEHSPTSEKDAGHVVIYLGNNKILNDGQIVNADFVEKNWGLKYLGWIDPTEAGFTAKKRTASELHNLMDGYKKTWSI